MRKRLIWAALLATACTKSSSEGGAPIVNGSYLIFEVAEPTGTMVAKHDVKVSFAKQGNVFDMKIETTEPETTFESVRVDARLVPETNVIRPYDLGRLWLPPEGRALNKRTPCGRVSGEQKYRDWEVYRVDGVCACNSR